MPKVALFRENRERSDAILPIHIKFFMALNGRFFH